MERLENFLNQLNSSYPLNIFSSALCISLANSGRRGNAKEFHITLESFISSLENIKEHLDAFSASYDETTWRNAAENFFMDNHAKSLCGVQTRPYFETVNKFVSWANELRYVEGRISLTQETLEKTLSEINKHCLKNVMHYPLFDEMSLVGLDENQIVDVLAAKLQEERQNSWGTQYFGFKYAQCLADHTNIIPSVLQKAGVDSSLSAEINKGRGVFKRAIEDGFVVKWYWKNDGVQLADNRERILVDDETEENIEGNNDFSLPDFSPTQIIYYGVPGCGKSYEVNKVINAELDKHGVTDKEYHKVRCVFHPEYCNADFVGQIYPYVKPDNGGVEYRFKPGPFAEIVRRAYRNPAEPFFLVIEEINRGNAAAIFGEMFQLLDRIRPEDGPEELSGNIYNTGWSSYGVTNIDVNAYIRQKSTDNPEKIEYDDSIPYGDKIKFINNTAVRLPPNLSIYATMNTNDQNVFTMDNAFQRRFKSKMIRNVLDENSAQYKTEIDDTGVYWGDFRKWINEKILLPQTAVLKADDKCLGGWFITGEKINGVDKIKKEDFAEKVLKYLWDDVFKRNKSGEIFVKDDKVKSLSDLIDAFETSVGFESFEKIFKMNDVDKAKLKKQANT